MITYLEIRNQKHLMKAEGTADKKPSYAVILAAVKNRGYHAFNVNVTYDHFQNIWRFNGDIKDN